MDAAVVTRARQLISQARNLCASAQELSIGARATRAAVAECVRTCASRRMARLARGASTKPVEERRPPHCPFCLSTAVTLDVMDRLIKAVYRCDECETFFLYPRPRPAEGLC